VFFRANTVADAFAIIGKVFSFSSYHLSQLSLYAIPVAKKTVFATDVFLGWLFIFVVLILEAYKDSINIESRNTFVRWSAYLIGIVLILGVGVFRSAQFIYFQF